MFDQRQLTPNCLLSNCGFQLKAVILGSPDSRQKGWKICVTFPGMQLPGERCEILQPTWSEPFHCQTGHGNSWINLTSLSQSCQHVYCMTILKEEFWCFVNFELFEHCVCVTEQCPNPLPPTPRHPELRVDTKPPPDPPFVIYNIWLPIPDALWTCEVIYFKNGCCGDCVWYYCSYLSF